MTILSESSGLKLTMNIQMPGLGQRREAEEEAVGAISLRLRRGSQPAAFARTASGRVGGSWVATHFRSLPHIQKLLVGCCELIAWFNFRTSKA